jgi:8-oxo-dGTP diphosphatase
MAGRLRNEKNLLGKGKLDVSEICPYCERELPKRVRRVFEGSGQDEWPAEVDETPHTEGRCRDILRAKLNVAQHERDEARFLIHEARIACPLCRGKGYWSTDVYKNRPCHCKAGEMFASLTRPQVRVGVAVILRRNGADRSPVACRRDAVLMGKRKGSHGAGTWSFPGGHLEPGETIFECAARELREETGIARDPDYCFRKLTFTNDIFASEGKHYITIYVETDFADGTPQPTVMEPEKCVEWAFWTEPPSSLFLPIENLLKDGFRIWEKAQSEK